MESNGKAITSECNQVKYTTGKCKLLLDEPPASY